MDKKSLLRIVLCVREALDLKLLILSIGSFIVKKVASIFHNLTKFGKVFSAK